ncbi:MAG: hypothetical protein AAGG09_02320 [Pseudomonadota bacterium]
MAEALLTSVQVWLWIGVLVAAVFLGWGIDRIDEDARGAYVFRPLLVPGVMLLWPLVLWRWWQLETLRDDWLKRHDPPRRAHTLAAVGMAGAIVLALGLGLANRQVWPADIAPLQLTAPGVPTQDADG